ncbi:MAG: chromosome segregation protein SMC [Robiginitomaculum sp.]|nr:MAG: chromosome segregation protein SMC [Robiginitomaculum sp.]
MGSLRFNSIKLVGFKSFVEPTSFQIEPGLTGIVGPNGCGKSNLLEAIRWVMGANSAKAMRASGMDDVIFSGTKSRPGRGQASVTLTIDNSARVAPPMFNDDEILEITRTITRGSGSKYQVNNKTVRAKDVQLLFADASTGANSPALVRQGQINELISAKPANRRRILEEAAGISGLHTRRHEAELRLRAAENNLDRLEDILGQIESQLLSLRRQSRQASRYKRLAGEIREYKALLWLKRWQSALEALDTSAQTYKDSQSKVVDLTRNVAKLTTEVTNITTTLEPHREEQIIAAAVCGRLNAAKDALENDAQAAHSEIKKLEARLTFLQGDIEREEGIVLDANNASERLGEEFEELKATRDVSGALAAAKKETMDAIEARTSVEGDVNTLTRKSAEHAALVSSATRESAQLESRKSRLEDDVNTVKASHSTLEATDNSAQEQSLFTASLTEAHEALEKARDTERSAASRKQNTETQEREMRDALNTVKQALSEAEAEQRAFSSIVNSARGDSNWPSALESLQVEKGYEAALAAAFGEDLDAGLEDELPLRWGGATTPSTALPNGLKSLSHFVKAPDELHARLSQIGIVDSADGDTLAKQLQPGQRIVSVEGDLWRWDGFCASSDVPSPAAARLENMNRLAEIEDKIPALNSIVATANSKWEEARNARANADDSARLARKALPQLEQTERAAQSTLGRFETEQARKTEQKSALVARLERLEEEFSSVVTLFTKAQEQAAHAGNNEELERELSEANELLVHARAHADETSGNYRSLKNEVEARASRLRSVEKDLSDWVARAAKAKERITSLHGREAETAMALATANDSPDEFAQRQQTLLSELSQAEQRRRDASDKLAEIETALRLADGNLRAEEQALGTAREARAASEARLTAAQERREEIQSRILETLSCEPDELTEQFEELSPDNKMPEPDIERKLERLSRERENMGAVNLRADEEASEQEDTLKTLTAERLDLVAAIATLREGIESLNAEGRERLLKAFDIVNDHFGRLFVTLFGGGSASLALTESDDPLEAGLEVLVSPPGKKLGSMSLMSGGEQALTATALIFAVFLSNPAPLCVLDEVDAPLDDANVERYCDLLDEMCQKTDTKFIAITHNPVTMARMDRIFGVTMAEKGVSQLISIDLGTAEKLTA